MEISKITYGLSILKPMFQILCKKNMNLVQLQLQVNQKQKKQQNLNGFQIVKKHKDDVASLKEIIGCDDCQLIKKIGNWEIELTLENNFIEEKINPDWFGYKRIDNI